MNKGLIVGIALALSAGTFTKPGQANGEQVKLEGSKWSGVTITTAAGQVMEGDAKSYRLEFMDDGGVMAKLDCNTAGGGYEATAQGALSIGAMRMTRAKCPEGSLDMVLVGQLGAVESYSVAKGELTLGLSNGGRLVWKSAK
ncbi:MAG: META domain-containing protein [Deltaproteobacteria bacterium]